ncbi:hypothetical protein EJB05_42179, partial [Eragrostis curvula]
MKIRRCVRDLGLPCYGENNLCTFIVRLECVASSRSLRPSVLRVYCGSLPAGSDQDRGCPVVQYCGRCRARSSTSGPPPPSLDRVSRRAAPRRGREAEVSALASATRPVSSRAAVFREPSPAPSNASSTAAAPELPPDGPRASSLIQRWREIEAVGPATPRDASASGGSSPRGRVGYLVKKLSGASSPPEDELAAEAAITSREIETSVRLVLPGELAKHAVSEGTKAERRRRA